MERTEMAKRFPIALPAWHEKRLIWWAAMKNASKTMLAQNILQARVEANDGQIQTMLEERAKDMGKTVEQLKKELLDASSYSYADSDGESEGD